MRDGKRRKRIIDLADRSGGRRRRNVFVSVGSSRRFAFGIFLHQNQTARLRRRWITEEVGPSRQNAIFCRTFPKKKSTRDERFVRLDSLLRTLHREIVNREEKRGEKRKSDRRDIDVETPIERSRSWGNVENREAENKEARDTDADCRTKKKIERRATIRSYLRAKCRRPLKSPNSSERFANVRRTTATRSTQ